MKTYYEKTIKTVDQVYCDGCGNNCSKEQLDHQYAVLEAVWGYGSSYDGTKYDIQLCEHCFTNIIDFIKQKRKRILGPFVYPYENDPLGGESYL